MGLHAFAMSRFSGVWTSMKTIQEVVESAASIDVSPDRVNIVLPQDFAMPPGGVHIRWPDTALEQEARLFDYKWYAALAYIRAYKLNHNVIEGPNDRFGLIASGKAYNDTRQALIDLGLDDATCGRIGLRLHKVNVVWPLEVTTNLVQWSSLNVTAYISPSFVLLQCGDSVSLQQQNGTWGVRLPEAPCRFFRVPAP